MIRRRYMSLKKHFVSILLIIVFTSTYAQNKCEIYGLVLDQQDEPIPFASIYIPELSAGFMANIDGSYQLSLPCGKYDIVFQCIGFKAKQVNIDLSERQTDYNVKLNIQPVNINQVSVNSDSEDPAYNIIRKAMVLAQYYKKQIKAYDCDVYVRSYYDVDKIPYLAEKLMSEEDLRDVKVGNIYEALLHYSYEYPNQIKEKILHVKTGDNDTNKTGSNYINLGFYNLGGPTIINPLSKNAFSVYEFEFINSFAENNRLVNKIKITPKRKGNDLMEGFIFINEDTWNINTVDVKFKQQLIEVAYKQIYSEVKPNAWMPVNHDIKVESELVGFRVNFQYLASLSNINVSTDSIVDLKIQQTLKQNNTDVEKIKTDLIKAREGKELSKTETKINTLIQKEDLNKKETLKLVRLIKRQEAAESYKTEEDLEISRNFESEYADSAFVTSDSLWNKLRKIPLSFKETELYVARDSLNLIISGDTIINEERRLIANLFVFNGFIKTGNKKERLQLPGLFRQLRLNFNTVDGITIDKTLFNYRRNYSEGRFYSIEPRFEFLLARPGSNKEIAFQSIYNAKTRAGFNINAGKVSEDFNREQGIEPFFNTISSLIFEENYKKIFQKEFIRINHQFDIKNGLSLSSTLDIENRTQKQNNSSLTFFNRKDRSYTSNVPSNLEVLLNDALLENHQATNFSAELSYTPKYFYRFRNEQKEMLFSNFPTYKLKYTQGLNNVMGSDNEFYLLEFSIQQSRKYKLIDKISYFAGAGKFLGTQSNYFADYKAFATTPFFISGQRDTYSFRLLDYYSFNANEYYLQGHFSIEDNALLLKRLPGLNETSLTEELHFNYLYTEQEKHFYEFGYSINRILLFMNLETFVSFENHKHNATGFRLSLQF